MATVINVFETTVQNYLQAEAYEDGKVQVSISDDVIFEAQLDDPTPNSESIRKAIKKGLGEVGLVVPVQIEGRDF